MRTPSREQVMGNDSECLDHPQLALTWRDMGSGWAEPAAWAMKARQLGWPNALRMPLWCAILAVLVGLGLLLAFHQVVLGAVQQGELRRKATAMQAEAASRCNALSGTRSREICLMQLDATPVGREGSRVATVATVRR
jgi:hypothetical protein